MRKLTYVMAVALLATTAVLMAGAAYGADGWSVAAQDLPSKMVWDAGATGSVDTENTGDTTWDSNYALVSVDGATEAASAVDRWGAKAVPVMGEVDPEGTYTFDLFLKAPPITTLRYAAPATPISSPQLATVDCNWMLANPYDPPTFITDDTAVQATTITRFPDDQPGTAGAWAAPWIDELAGRAPLVVGGYPDGYYRPLWVVTRDQMAVFMARALNLPLEDYEGFFGSTDVPESQWAWPWIEALVRKDIVRGFPDGYYRPGWPVTRDQMAAYVAFGIWGGRDIPSGPAEPTFPDVPTTYPYYNMIEFAYDQNVVKGYPDGKYWPLVNVTRDQMAVFIWKGFVMPTGSAVAIAGPATTSFDPAATDYVGWSTTDVSPSYAYVAFDALRLDTNLLTPSGTPDWDVCFDIYEYDLGAGRGDLVDTVCAAVTEEDMLAAKEAAAASGDPYLVVSAALPDLDPGVYQLVTRVETASFSELARAPIFTVGESLPIVAKWGKEEALALLGGAVDDSTPKAGTSESAMAKSDDVYFQSVRNTFPDDDWCNWNHAHAIVFHGVPADATSISMTLEYRVNSYAFNLENNCCDQWGDALNGNVQNCCDSWGGLDYWTVPAGMTPTYNYLKGNPPYGWGCRVMSGAAGGNWQDQWYDADWVDTNANGDRDRDYTDPAAGEDEFDLVGSGDPNVPADNDVQGGGPMYDHIGFTGHPWVDTSYQWGTTDVASYRNPNGDVLVVFCGGSYQTLSIDQAVLTYTR
jgi:hypothetical protein